MSDVGIKHSKPTTEAERQQEESSRSRPGANLGPGSGSSSSSLRPSDFFSLSPFALMRRWTEEMDQVFSVPPVSMRERDGKWVVTVDLPGLVKEEVAVEIADQNLIIQGKRNERTKSGKQPTSVHTERSIGLFRCRKGLTRTQLAPTSKTVYWR